MMLRLNRHNTSPSLILVNSAQIVTSEPTGRDCEHSLLALTSGGRVTVTESVERIAEMCKPPRYSDILGMLDTLEEVRLARKGRWNPDGPGWEKIDKSIEALIEKQP